MRAREVLGDQERTSERFWKTSRVESSVDFVMVGDAPLSDR